MVLLASRISRRVTSVVVLAVLAAGGLVATDLAGASAAGSRPVASTANPGAAPAARAARENRVVRAADVSDSYVSYAHPNLRPGRSPKLEAVDSHSNRRVVYLKFRLGGLPAHTVARHEDLHLTRTSGRAHATTLHLYRVHSTHWTQAKLDAKNRPHGVHRLAKRHVRRHQWRVTFHLHVRMRAHHRYSFAVTSSARHGATRFGSKESSDGPRLLVHLPEHLPARVPTPKPVGIVPLPLPTATPTVAPTSPTPTSSPTTSPTSSPSPTSTPTTTPTSATPTPTPTTSSTSPTCTLTDELVPTCGTMLGAYASSWGGSTIATAFQNFNAESGSTISVDHDYLRPGQVLSSADTQIAETPGDLLLVNWKPAYTWSDANGSNASVNAQIDAMAESIKALGNHKIFLSIFHEPENDVSGGASGCPSTIYKGTAGTPADYQAMWANVESRFAALDVTNVVWTMIYMGFTGWDCMIDDLWPGNSLVDWVLWDPYASNNEDYVQAVSPFYNELTNLSDSSHNYLSKPWGLGEFGDRNTSDANQEDFYTTVAQSLDSNQFPKMKLLELYDAVGSTGDYRVAYDEAGNWDQLEVDDLEVLSSDPSIVGGRVSIADGWGSE